MEITFAFLSPQDMIVILVIALLVFGPQKLPEVGRQMGNLMREMNRMTGDMRRTLDIDEYIGHDTHRYDTPRYEPPYGPTYPQVNSYAPYATEPTNGSAQLMSGNFAEPPGPQVAVPVANSASMSLLADNNKMAERVSMQSESVPTTAVAVTSNEKGNN